MALGTHWEWRGFGAVSSKFADSFSKLERIFSGPQEGKDLYLWIPKLEANVKVRDIPTEPFKIKRIKAKDGDLEQWDENPDEIFEFPLNDSGWDTLAEMLDTVKLKLGPKPSGRADRSTVLDRLAKVGVKTVGVKKLRESRLWQGPNGKVQLEWACISSPQAIISVGLETWDEDPDKEGLPNHLVQEDILSAIKALGLDKEPLTVMNYMGAVAVWAFGGKL
jgi:hypothetical protein